jgi:hypothetical protein
LLTEIDYGAIIWIVSSVETNIGIIFTCMHAMRPVLSKLVPTFFASASASKKHTPNTKSWTESSQSGFSSRLKSIAAKFTGGNKGKTGKSAYADNSGNDNSLASNTEFSTEQNKDYFHGGSGKVNALVTTGSGSQGAPADSIMYDQRVVVVRESKE